MKTYQDEKLGFAMDVPDEWLLPAFGAARTPVGESVVFGCGYFEAFNLQIGLLNPEPSAGQTENEFRQYVQGNNFSSLEFGRLVVSGKEHIWARYYVGGGRWNKKYLVVLNGVEYAITATCFYQNRLLEREQVWDAVVASFRLLAPAQASPAQPTSEPKASSAQPTPEPKAAPLQPAPEPKRPSEPEKIPEAPVELPMENVTLTFSILAYGLIALLALIYMLSKADLAVLFSLSSVRHAPLSDFEFNAVLVVIVFGIGALTCLGFLLGVVLNARSPDNASTFFSFMDRTMQIRDRQKETVGGIVFSDYTRSPQNLVDGLRLQVIALLHALIKIITIPFSFVQVHPFILLFFVIFLILSEFILRLPLTVPGEATYIAFLFYFCYRAFLFQTAKRKDVTRIGDVQKRHLVISDPSLDSAIQAASKGGVTPDLIRKILSQESVIAAIKDDLAKTGQIGYREIWRLGLITPDQDTFDLRLSQLSRQERVKKILKDANSLQNFRDQISFKRSAVLHSTAIFGTQFNNILVTNGAIKHLGYPGWSYSLSTKLKAGEWVRLRDIQINGNSTFTENRSLSLTKFLQEDGFPLKNSYADGDPLTTERGGTIVIERGKVMVIYLRYFVQRRLIDDAGNLVEIGLDEDFSQGVTGIKMQPSVSEGLFRYVSANGCIPIVRYRFFPYASDFMLPLLDTPMSASGWADLYVDPQGKARLFIAKQKTLAEWYEMMDRLKQLLFAELAKKEYHLLGLTKDAAQLSQYLFQKQEILKDYFMIEDLKLF